MAAENFHSAQHLECLCSSIVAHLLEVELSSRAQEDEEERRKQKGANTASASHAQKGGGKGKPKPICRDFMTENGCQKGGQCLYQKPPTLWEGVSGVGLLSM